MGKCLTWEQGREEFKRLKRWVEECPTEAGMRIEQLEKELEQYKLRSKEYTNTLNDARRKRDSVSNELAIVLKENKGFRNALRKIDTHIRADENPVPYIIETLKNTLPEYKEL